jgi:hypothetical protein
MMLGRSPILHAVSRLDPIRLKRLQRALREGMKPSRWYDDDPTDTKSLYRRRWLAGLDICRDTVQNSPDRDLVQFAEKALSDAREQLPLTFAAWEEDKG